MPKKPRRPCRHPGCPNLCDSGVYCKEHAKYSSDRLRGSATERGYDSDWRRERKRFLRENPLCVKCLKKDKLRAATVVDHIIPHRGDEKLFWDRSNWQPLCADCHGHKTGCGL